MTEVGVVARHFDRGAAQYNELATVQQHVSQELLRLVEPEVCDAQTIVDLGCGTGQLLIACRQLNAHAELTGVDLAAQMLQQVPINKHHIEVLQANLEGTSLPEGRFDLVLSSSALQWSNLPRAMHEAARLCAPGGKVAVACFLTDTLNSWRDLWGGRHQRLPNVGELHDASALAGLRIVRRNEARIIQSFSRFESALASVRGVGAGANSRLSLGLMGRRKLAMVKHAFTEAVADTGGFPMEYEVAYLVAEHNSAGFA